MSSYVGYSGIDRAYRIVQTILNENHYGTLKPTRFNELVYTAQMKVFVDSLNFIKRIRYKDYNRRSRDYTYKLYKEALSGLAVHNEELDSEPEDIMLETRTIYKKPDNFSLDISLVCNNANGEIRDVEIVPIDSDTGLFGHLMTPTDSFPIGVDRGDSYEAIPDNMNSLYLSYYRYPKVPNWTYYTVNDKPVFDSSHGNYQDIEVGEELFDEILYYILQDAGMHLQRKDITEFYNQKESYNYQKEIQ